LIIFLFWIAFSIVVGMFASIRRDRSSLGWFLLALIISPLLAGTFVAILQPKALPVAAPTGFWDDLTGRTNPYHPESPEGQAWARGIADREAAKRTPEWRTNNFDR
jgi:hypothetical protein